MVRIKLMSQTLLRAELSCLVTGFTKIDKSLPRIWMESTETLNELLSEENRNLLQEIRLNSPESIQEVSDAMDIPEEQLMQRLQLLINFRLLRFEGENGMLRPVVDDWWVQVMMA